MEINGQTIVSLLASSVRVTTPIMFVAMSGCFSEQAGVFAMGMEGFMLIGAFAAVVIALMTNSLFIGVIGGILAGVLLAALFGLASITLGSEQVLSGLAINMFAMGATGFLMRVVWGTSGIPLTPQMLPVPIPLLSEIPIIGQVFFKQPILTYVGYISIPLAWWFMYKSRWGLELRAVGEKPRAVDTVGISVKGTRYMAVLLCGALSGMGGAVLSLQQVNTFTENMSAGRGWLGLIACIFGRWNPLGAAGASFLFGMADALQLRIQIFASDLSSWIILMIPHLLALILISIVAKEARHPAAAGVHYTKE
jgi:general nucleoside transport system permease protein